MLSHGRFLAYIEHHFEAVEDFNKAILMFFKDFFVLIFTQD